MRNAKLEDITGLATLDPDVDALAEHRERTGNYASAALISYYVAQNYEGLAQMLLLGCAGACAALATRQASILSLLAKEGERIVYNPRSRTFAISHTSTSWQDVYVLSNLQSLTYLGSGFGIVPVRLEYAFANQYPDGFVLKGEVSDGRGVSRRVEGVLRDSKDAECWESNARSDISILARKGDDTRFFVYEWKPKSI